MKQYTEAHSNDKDFRAGLFEMKSEILQPIPQVGNIGVHKLWLYNAVNEDFPSPKDSVDDILNGENSYCPINLIHIEGGSISPVLALIEETSKKWLSGQYSDAYPGGCGDCTTHLLALRELCDKSAVLICCDVAASYLSGCAMLSEVYDVPSYLTSNSAVVLRACCVDESSGSDFFDYLSSDYAEENSAYFYELISKDNEARAIMKERQNLDTTVTPAHSPVSPQGNLKI